MRGASTMTNNQFYISMTHRMRKKFERIEWVCNNYAETHFKLKFSLPQPQHLRFDKRAKKILTNERIRPENYSRLRSEMSRANVHLIFKW